MIRRHETPTMDIPGARRRPAAGAAGLKDNHGPHREAPTQKARVRCNEFRDGIWHDWRII